MRCWFRWATLSAYAMIRTPKLGSTCPIIIIPALKGTYLAACVFFAALSGRDPRTLDGIPDIAPDTAATLRSIARDTLQGSTKEDLHARRTD